ncbi:MAG: AraC family transcriptional regulator [Victivallales bacterium]
MDYINEHVGDAFGLPDLASELGLSVPHTSCVVKRLFGKSFSALLQERRVEKAKYFLNGTELSLHEIAELCGFSSEFHLSRVFKQLNGIPPGQYRGKREI